MTGQRRDHKYRSERREKTEAGKTISFISIFTQDYSSIKRNANERRKEKHFPGKFG